METHDAGTHSEVQAIAVPVSLSGSGLSPRGRTDLSVGDGFSSGRLVVPRRSRGSTPNVSMPACSTIIVFNSGEEADREVVGRLKPKLA